MHTLRIIPFLALIGCADVMPDAADPTGTLKRDDEPHGTSARLDALAAQNELLQSQLNAAIAQIDALETRTTAAEAASQAAAAEAAAARAEVSTVVGDLYLATDDGRVSRIEALEGSLLEVDAADGAVVSNLNGARLSSPLYNKIKWTFSSHSKDTPGGTILGASDGVAAMATELFLPTDDGGQVSRIEALEGSLLEVDAADGAVVSNLNGARLSSPLYNKIKWTFSSHSKDTPGGTILGASDGVAAMATELFLPTEDGGQVSRIEALEGSLLEVDAADGAVVSNLNGARLSSPLYNKIKWTFSSHSKDTPGGTILGASDGLAAMATELFLPTDDGGQVSRIEALEGSLLEVDSADGAVVSNLDGARLSSPLYNKIKWTYTTRTRDTPGGTILGASAGVEALSAAQRSTQRMVDQLGIVDDVFDAGFEGLCGVAPKKGGLSPADSLARCGVVRTQLASLERSAAVTSSTLDLLQVADAGFKERLAELSSEDGALWVGLEGLDKQMCELKATTGRVLRGRWDDSYEDGGSPGFWSGLAVDTPDGPLTWESWVEVYFPEAGVCEVDGV